MRTKIFIIAIAVSGLAGRVGAQAPVVELPGSGVESAAEIGILPKQKEEMTQKYLMNADERNPFAKRIQKSKGTAAVDTENEESRIRAALETFSVSGIAKGGSGYKAQLGSIILSEGELIPRLIPGQSDDLRVTKITPELVEITWVADENADRPRQVSLAVDMGAKVGVILPVGRSSAAPAGKTQLVYQSDEEPK
jgi:hypothetical protein